VRVGEAGTVRVTVGCNVDVAVGVGAVVAVELGVAPGWAVQVKATVGSGNGRETEAAVGVMVGDGRSFAEGDGEVVASPWATGKL
jgi:hypothetical protein